MLLVVGVGLLLARAAGFAEVRDAIERADSSWFAVCLAAQVLALVRLRGGRSRRASPGAARPDPGLRLSARVMLASIGATRVFAAGGVGAIAVSYWCFRRARFASDEALVRVLGFNVLFYVAFGVGAWAAALVAALGSGGEMPVGLTAPWLVLVPLVAVAALRRHPASSRGAPDRAAGLHPAPRARVRGRGRCVGARGPLAIRTGRQAARGDGSLLGGERRLSLGLAALGRRGPPASGAVLAFAAGHAAMILPLPLGGVGGVDAALTYALTAVGVPLAVALVAVGVYRLFSFWAPTIPALAALLVVPRTGTRLARLAPVASLR